MKKDEPKTYQEMRMEMAQKIYNEIKSKEARLATEEEKKEYRDGEVKGKDS